MSDAHVALRDGLGEALDALKEAFFDSSTEVLFLKPSTDAGRDFELIWQVADKWFFEYSEFRQQFLLEIAVDDDLTQYITQATHVQIDDDVYELVSNDTLPPKGTDVTWKLFCTKYARRANYAAL